MPRKNPEAIRAALKKDPNTAKLAAALKLPAEEYVDLVVHYATTGAEPQFMIVPDAELKAAGHTPPDMKKMTAFLTEAVAVKKAHEDTDYTPAKRKLVAF